MGYACRPGVFMRQRRRLEILTNSRARARRRCARYHHLRYALGVRPARDDEDLRIGTLAHGLLERAFIERMNLSHPCVSGYIDRRIDDIIDRHARADPFEAALVEAMLIGYHEVWGEDGYEVLEVETEFYCPLRNPDTGAASQRWLLGGKVDAIVRKPDGRLAVLEHKTTSRDISPGSFYWRQLRMDGQVSLYFEGARALGYDVEEVIYDVIAKPGYRPKKATPPELRKYRKDNGELYAGQREADETPAEYGKRCRAFYLGTCEEPKPAFAREPIVRLERDLEDNARDLWQLAQAMREDELSGRAPRNPDACELYNKQCEMVDLCTGDSSLEADPQRWTLVENPHAELEHIPPDTLLGAHSDGRDA